MISFVALLAIAIPPGEKMPITGLAPAQVQKNLCVYQHRVSTASPQCQTFCDQALGYYYSYVWMEAVRNFETALKYDPDCAFAWLGLSKALDKWGKTATPNANPLLGLVGGLTQPTLPARYIKPPKDLALEKAKALLPKASHRENLLITAKLQERGMWPNTPEGERKKKATATLDELLTLYEDDEEGWFARAQIAEGVNGAVPFYKALLKVNPLHPGANHELVHFFEGNRRPALGWPYAEKYMESSAGIPHAFHMQAHLAMRIGKWQHTTDWSSRAIDIERAYHKALSVKPADDHQFQHHMETLTRSLVHDGRFAEASQIKAEATKLKYYFRPEWLRMAIATEDWKQAESLAGEVRKSDKAMGAYWAALIALARGDVSKAKVELDVLKPKGWGRLDKRNEVRQWEVEGRILCATNDGDAGLKLLRQAVVKTKDDYNHHAWGGGAVLMEAWGVAALDCGNAGEADEAFQEALAHDAGSVCGALGMWALSEHQGRMEEAERYLKLARKCWSRAESKDFERMKEMMAKKIAKVIAEED